MPPWSRFTAASHRVSIAGRVVDALTTRPLESVVVTMVLPSTPPTFQARIAARALEHGPRWSALPERTDRTATARDGCFRFVDLPDGAYTLSFSMPGLEAPNRYGTAQQSFTVPGDLVTHDPQGSLVITVPLVALPPTAVRGQIKGGEIPGPLPMARVRVRGTGELAYGDADGRFYLTGVEPGKRLLELTASGHQAATTPAQIVAGQITELGSFVLQLVPP